MFRNLGLFVIMLVSLLLAACGATAAPTPATHSAEHDMAGMAGDAPFDAAFIDGMIVHHQGAINMANQAQQEATRPEIKAMAEAIIATQQAEIEQMTAWRKNWYPDLSPTAGLEMDMGPMDVANDSSKPFDQRFLEAMIPHHEGAIHMANAALEQAEHTELKQTAAVIVQVQQTEIEQMQQWLKTWYNQ